MEHFGNEEDNENKLFILLATASELANDYASTIMFKMNLNSGYGMNEEDIPYDLRVRPFIEFTETDLAMIKWHLQTLIPKSYLGID